MDVLKEIYWKSALGILPNPIKSLVLLIFTAIVAILFTMFYLLLKHGHYLNVQFGY
jgi:hypothetical protein